MTLPLQDSEVTTAGLRLQVGQKCPISRENNDPHARVSLIFKPQNVLCDSAFRWLLIILVALQRPMI